MSDFINMFLYLSEYKDIFYISDWRFYMGLIIGVVMGIYINMVKIKWISRLFSNYLNEPRSCGSTNKLTGEFKMALLVRNDLKMGKGKVAAQCSHAIVHCYEKGMRLIPKEISSWELNNMPLDIFKVADEETMLRYQRLAIKNDLNTYIVIDAGRTQVAPMSKTVMAIGPAKSEQIYFFTQCLQCAIASIISFKKSKLLGLPSKCARIVLKAPDLETMMYIEEHSKSLGICTTPFKENNKMTVLVIGPANEISINAQVHNLKLY